MGRHTQEGDSQPLTAPSTSVSTGRHRTHRKMRSLSLTSFFRRSRHRPGAPVQPNEFGHTGADAAWGGTLTGLVAVTKPNMTPVPQPKPTPVSEPVPTPARVLVPMPQLAAEFVQALMPATPPSELDLAHTAHLDAPTHYQRFTGAFHPPTVTVNVPVLRTTLPARS